ncbi:ester cyclase [Amycolatopsis pigmentata]|uniref:Ester cyclase n=1 Tax=Amycolatopsis pigmentata TaxID=450801 RepID=A0ABW5FTF2_9PSEU
MHVRSNMLIGDPARVDEVLHYIEDTVRPYVEAQPGSRGIAVAANFELGVIVTNAYWDSADAMTASEHAVQTGRKEAAELLHGMVTVDHYEAPVFLRHRRPGRGAGLRVTTIESDPADLDVLVDVFRDTALPRLARIPSLCSAQLLIDRASGHCQAIVAYDSASDLAATRANVARIRSDSMARTHATVRSVQEYTVIFTSVREGGTTSLIERETELWNAHDREQWTSLFDQQAFELRATGGIRVAGRDALDLLWYTCQDAFPDNHVENLACYGDDHGGVLEGRFTGTHTGPLRTRGDEIPATGKSLEVGFCGVYRVQEGKIIGASLYFDRLDALDQMDRLYGITPA